MVSSPLPVRKREESSIDVYAPDIERMMKRLFDSLTEDHRRRYAAIEAAKLGHGGTEYIAQILECDPKTIRRGKSELEGTDELDITRVRNKGGASSDTRSSDTRSSDTRDPPDIRVQTPEFRHRRGSVYAG
jgi:hypothetical protein